MIVAFVAACGMITILFVDRNRRPIERIDRLRELSKFADSPQEPIAPKKPLDLVEIRRAERSRRAERPVGDPKREDGLNYEGVLKGRTVFGLGPRPRPAKPMPPTSCRSVGPVPEDEYSESNSWGGPRRLHYLTVALFEDASGFGFWRLLVMRNDRGVTVSSRAVDRVELVSLLVDDEPSAYVLDEMATPSLARQAKRRPLDEFERLGLDAVRRGEGTGVDPGCPDANVRCDPREGKIVWTCHANAKEGDLLGAFTYYLNASVDKLKVRE